MSGRNNKTFRKPVKLPEALTQEARVSWRPNIVKDERLKADYASRMERMFTLRREALQLLDLINAEFKSDPKSVQHFDSRIVLRVDEVLAELRSLDLDGEF